MSEIVKKETVSKKDKKFFSRLFLGFFCFIIGFSFGSWGTSDTEDQIAGLETQVVELTAKVESAKPYFDLKDAEKKKMEAQAATEKKRAEVKAKLAKSFNLSNGRYTAGKDFPAGVYDLFAIKGGGNVSSDNMFDGGINAVMGIADDGFYQKTYRGIDLPDGTEINIDAVTINFVPN